MTTATMDNDGKVKFHKTKKAKAIVWIMFFGIVAYLIWVNRTLTEDNTSLTKDYSSLTQEMHEATVISEQYIVENLNVSLSHKWYMPWTDQVVRFSGTKIKGTLCPTDKTFEYAWVKEEFKLTHTGRTSIDLTTLEPGSKVNFDGGGISGWIQLPNNKESEVANLHISVDLNFDIITEK